VPEPKNRSTPTKYPKLLFGFIFISCLATSAVAQSTIQFGFEEFQIKDLPPFVTGQASVQDSASSIYVPTAAFEGQKFLVGYAGISIASPDGQPIESFRLRVFLGELPQSLSPWYVTVGNQSLITRGVAEWQTFQGTFNSPVPSVNIQAYVSFETIPGYFGVDDVQFITVPEPKTFWLIPLGCALIAFRPLLKRSIR
jgi:hypothetical protein